MSSRTSKIIDKYCRISESYDGTFRSVDDQDADGTATIEEAGYQVGETFKDPFKSGWNPDVVRDEFKQLIARAVAGQSDGIWVYDLTRFTRKPAEGEPLLTLANKGFIILSEDGEYDLSRADGRKRFRDALSQAAYESDKISERTRRGKRKKAERRGLSNAARRAFGRPGFQPRPEGWVRDGTPPTPVPDDQVQRERDAVRYIARLVVDEEGTFKACRYLIDEGFTTVTGKTFTPSRISELLKCPALAGLVVYNGKIVPGKALPGEPVLDMDTWNRLQLIFAGRRRGPKRRKYLLTGLMYCGECGAHMNARPVSNVKPYEDGSIAREYLCQQTPGRGGCYRVAIDMRYADTVVGAMVLVRLGDPELRASLAVAASEVAGRRGELQRRIDDHSRLIVDATARGAERGWTFDRVDAFCAPYQQQIDAWRREIHALEVAAPSAPSTPAAAIANKWIGAGGPLRQRPWPDEASRDLVTLRRLVREAFPRLTVRRGSTGRGRGELRPDRFAWDGVEGDQAPK